MIIPWAAIVVVAPVEEEPAQVRDVLVVETVGFSREEFTSELQLRLPERKIIGVESPRPERGFVYVHVTRAPPDVVRFSIIESDGRAYDRELPHEPNQEVRVATSAIATLLASVEHGELAPDRQDVPMPDAEAPEIRVGDEVPREARETEPAVAAEVPSVARFEVGVDAHGSVGLGLAPATDAGVFGGAGGGIETTLRLASGPFASVGVRALRRVAEPFSVIRMRVSFVGGYDWRWSAFELRVGAGLGVEPWWVREAGDPATLRYEGEATNRRPMLGFVGLVAPGYIWRAEATGIALWVGPRLSLAGSSVFHDGARTVRLDRPAGGEPAARLGGLELEAGLGVTLWIPVHGQP